MGLEDEYDPSPIRVRRCKIVRPSFEYTHSLNGEMPRSSGDDEEMRASSCPERPSSHTEK